MTKEEFNKARDERAAEIRSEGLAYAESMANKGVSEIVATFYWLSLEIASAQIACEKLQMQMNEL